MRIDREAFLVAVAALAGCERADMSPIPPPPAARTEAQPPAITAREIAPAASLPLPEPEVTPPPAPRTVRRHPSPSKRWFLGLTMTERTSVTAVCEHRARTQCSAALHSLMPRATEATDDSDPVTPPEPEATEVAVASLPSAKVAAYCEGDFHPPTCETPLVVAFAGQPVDFAPAGGDRFAFVPGDPAATDWPTAATPWIALDLDGDGAITTGAELFGSSTVLANGARAVNGFAALAALDANGDGTLDARDPMFSRLVLWSDRNGDHRSTPDELRPLASTVTAISLAFTTDARCNERDDCEGQRGTLRWRDAAGVEHVGAVVDVYIPR